LGNARRHVHDVGVAPSDPLRALLAAAIEGDDVAVAALVRATQPAIWRMCARLGDAAEVEDLVQETYIRALGALDSYRGDAPTLVWLLSIARRVCADHVRRQQRRRRLHDRLVARRAVTQAPEIVDDLIDQLTPDRREAFVLTQLVGLSYEEAAQAIGCPLGTVRSRVARARADLMRTLAGAEQR
jgi:RNA polymerase sigma-70 factor (ECF subfamily)